MADRGGLGMVGRRAAALVSREPLSGRGVAGAVVLFVGLIAATGVVDYVTGSSVTFGVLYLIPVLGVAVLAGAAPAMAVAAIAATVWVVAELVIGDDDAGLLAGAANVALRFSIFAVVVGLVVATRDALHAAQASDRRSREFLAYTAHQLRTPSAAASTAAQALLARGGSAEQEELLVRLVAETRRSGRLVASILRFVRLEQGDPMPATDTELVELCVEEVARAQVLSPGLTVEMAPTAAPTIVRANREALQEAVGNLLDNARRHAAHRIAVDVTSAGGAVEVTVADDGPGIPTGAEDWVFEPFVTLDGLGGSGLGLAIARRLAESQGGTLAYRSGAFVLALRAT